MHREDLPWKLYYQNFGCDSITFTRHAFGKVNTETQMSLYFVKLFAATLPPSDSPYVDSLLKSTLLVLIQAPNLTILAKYKKCFDDNNNDDTNNKN